MMMNKNLLRKTLAPAAVVAGVLCLAVNAWTAPTDISSEPLASPVTNTSPNLMFTLDDSGSMGSNFSPDYIDDSTSGSNIGKCFDTKDGGTITGTPQNCRVGDVPFMSYQFNKQYYNPNITYQPTLNYDGSARNSMNSANTTGWTVVPYDAYGIQSTANINLITGYPDRVFCNANTATATDTVACKKNSGYNYPSDSFGFGLNSGGSIQYVYGTPYYYTINTTEFCDNASLIGTAAGAAGSRCVANTSAAYIASPATFPFAAPVRFCSGSNPLTQTFADCRDKHISTGGVNYFYPKFLGTVAASPGLATASATVTINAGTAAAAGISNIVTSENGGTKQLYLPTQSGITFGNVTMTNGVITASTGTLAVADQNNVANVINTAINNYTAISGYTSTVAANTVTIRPVTVGATILANNTDNINGETITITAPVTGVKATATFTVNATANDTNSQSLRINVGTTLISAAGLFACKTANSAANQALCATTIVNSINGVNSAAGAIPDFTATSTGNSVTITAANPTTAANGLAVTLSRSSGTPSTTISAAIVSGGTANSISTSTVSFSGGVDGAGFVRLNTGVFTRTNIVSGSTYPRALTRTDCAADPCTYAEEMTNFANWHAYYRTRIQMIKTAAGITFGAIDDAFRVGFLTINPMSSGTINNGKYLKIADFTSGVGGHKQLWYNKFYAQAVGNSTPLREALSRAGHIYAGLIGSSATTLTTGIPAADDPVQFSCQPNFTILSTDGYWNGSAGQKLDGTAIGNQDGVPTDSYSRGYTSAVTTAASNVIGVFEGTGATSTDSLADVAAYYYKTDLRPAMANNVRPRDYDDAPHQHMTTFTIGLGLDGFLSYNKNYNDSNLTTGDFYDVRRGSKVWPVPVADTPSALDDLWHAAVNGRGSFYSASNPQELVDGLVDALNTLQKATGAGAAAATSNLRPVAGDNFAFAGEYTTVDWSGDMKAYTLDLNNGYVSNNPLWSAKQQLDSRSYTQRNIYTFDALDPSPGNLLRNFCATSGGAGCSDGNGLTAGELALFSPTLLSQFGAWNTLQKTATAGALVDYIRGNRAAEADGSGGANDLFRARASMMADVVGSKPAYLKGATFNYGDTGYSIFRSCTLGTGTGCPSVQFPTPSLPRRPTLYVGGNGGMMHAFETDVNNSAYYQTAGISTSSLADDVFNSGNNTGNGVERWAYIPQMLLPNLKKLANTPVDHNFFVDGSPIIGDICTSTPCAGVNDWRTILVSGLRNGGRGFFALDVTDPLAPKGLWEFGVTTICASAASIAAGTVFADCHVGLSFGDPIITKRKSDGKWVVIVSSGLNNFNPGDGQGYIYVLDASTGKVLSRVATGVGSGGTAGASFSDANPSGLSRISAWADNPLTDNTTLAVYGGDVLGNMWRFDLDSASTGYLTATKLFQGKDVYNTVQPITTKPELALVSNKRVVSFATGKFVGITDKATTSGNTVYAIADDLSSTTVLKSSLEQRQLIVDSAGTSRSVISVSNTVLWAGTNKGWYADFPSTGGASATASSERAFVDPILQAGSFVVASTIPNSTDGCAAGGDSWLNTFNIATGLIPTGVAAGLTAGIKVTGIIVGFSLIQLPSGEIKTEVRLGTGESITRDTPVTGGSFGGKRVTWRELIGLQQ